MSVLPGGIPSGFAPPCPTDGGPSLRVNVPAKAVLDDDIIAMRANVDIRSFIRID
jgi:hypothetical protein